MNLTKKGLGPHTKPWPSGDMYDPELLEQGDYRNVIDKYRYWTIEAIKVDLDKSGFKIEIAIENLKHDYNIGTIIRNANAFGIRKVHIIGRRHYNRRGAMVTDAYLDIIYHKTVKDFLDAIKDRQLIAIDNVSGAEALGSFKLTNDAVFVFGSESDGLSQELIDASSTVVFIEQFGTTRSVNVGVASGIILYDALMQNIDQLQGS